MSTTNPTTRTIERINLDDAGKLFYIKEFRNNLLKESDWTAIPDANPKPSKEAWLTYRQALRDLPQTFKDPSEVIWPTKPE
jgi:hypothetical protein